MQMLALLTLALRRDQDVVLARSRTVQVGQLLGFDVPEQTRMATAVSEIARNAFRYAAGGMVTFAVDPETIPQRLVITISDSGPGIPHLPEVLSGRYRSTTGTGHGITGARRLMDRFSIEATARGTTVVLEKHLTPRQDIVTAERGRQLADALARRRPEGGLVEEIQQQNQALLRALDELQQRQEELVRLNRELEDTNRGVVALYAELDEKADHLRRADELKSRFLSNMTHEFRTPVNSIIGLSALLLDDRERDGREPEPEITYIRKAAEQLSDLVNDLLDLAKVEAGKIDIRPSDVDVGKLFGALRGMLRPMLLTESVRLVFDVPDDPVRLYTDEGKLSQILRNLLSNALKFTERGEVRVSVSPPDAEGFVGFAVADTGIGIAPEDQERVFDEFTQLEHRRLRHAPRGTGLGLPLSRRLAELLGGVLVLESTPGIGSVFTLRLPLQYAAVPADASAEAWQLEPGRVPLLVLDGEPNTLYFYEKLLRSSAYQVCPATTVAEAERALARVAPAAIVMDVAIDEDAAWNLLVRLRRAEATRTIPIVVASTSDLRQKALALGADAFLPKPLHRRALLDTLAELQGRTMPPLRVLAIDDEEVARYLLRECLPVPAFELTEAATAAEGLRRAREDRPDVILVDLVMPDLDGRTVLRTLRTDPATAGAALLVVTSQTLDQREQDAVLRDADALLSKADVTRGTLGDAIRAVRARTLREAPQPAPDTGATRAGGSL